MASHALCLVNSRGILRAGSRSGNKNTGTNKEKNRKKLPTGAIL